ncbi:methyltransferase domain-containing protein [Candidatus Dependentiae bacterium]|nr:methyltransferase domain-containing protein [Candidatus Dependentiae bacterium]
MNNTKQSISMYDLENRVKQYDIDMDIMHPNRPKMVDVVLNFLPYDKQAKIKAIDLGTGTGFFTKKYLEKFPNSSIIAIDGAEAMIELAKTRLGKLSNSVEFIVGDFGKLQNLIQEQSVFDVIFASFALHHLLIPEKENCLKYIFKLLKPNGWFFNADCVIGETQELENVYQKLRIEGILKRTEYKDPRFKDFATTRKWLDDLETKEEDYLIKVSEELSILQNAGFRNIDILWKEYREATWCAQK